MEQQSTLHEARGGFPDLVKMRLHTVLAEIGQAFTLFFQTLIQIFRPPFQFDLLVKQLLLIGFNSLAVVIVSGFFTGMVLGVQGYIQLKPYAVEGSVARFVCVSVVKELGPMITAFVLAGRIGASITAELSTMKVTEQIDALGGDGHKSCQVSRGAAVSRLFSDVTDADDLFDICRHLGWVCRCCYAIRCKWLLFSIGSPEKSVCREHSH